MCDPVSLTIAAVGVGTAAYSNQQAKKAADSAQAEATRQAELNRAAEARRAAEEQAFQAEQARVAREAEAQRVAEERAFQQSTLEQQRAAAAEALRLQQEQAGAQRAMQERMMAEQRAAFEAQQAAVAAEAERVRQAEIRRQNNISEGQGIISELFSQFGDNFYGQRQQAYTDFATPQLDRQYRDAMQSLVRSLARGGNLNSSVRAQSMADLQRQYDEGKATIANNALGYANNARSAIETARANLLSQNAALADPGTVRGLAQTQVGSLTAQQPMTPLASLISALTRNSGDAVGVNKKGSATQGVGLLSNSLTTNTGTVVA